MAKWIAILHNNITTNTIMITTSTMSIQAKGAARDPATEERLTRVPTQPPNRTRAHLARQPAADVGCVGNGAPLHLCPTPNSSTIYSTYMHPDRNFSTSRPSITTTFIDE